MQKNKNIALAKLGMRRDAAEDTLDEQSYNIAYNMNVENESGNLYKLKSEFSNILASKFKLGFKVIGVGTDELKVRTFFFLTNPDTGVSEIGTVQNVSNVNEVQDAVLGCKDCDYNKVLETPLEETTQTPHQEYITVLEDSCDDQYNKCLNFNIKYPIKQVVIKNEKLGTKVFFSDNYNPPRYFDESKLETYKQIGSTVCDSDTIEAVCVNCDKLRLFPQASPLTLEPAEIVLGGNLKLAQYTFYVAYSDSLGNELGEYMAMTNPIPIFDENNKILSQEEELQRTSSAIKLKILDLDSAYDYYKVVVSMINIVDAGTRHFVVGNYPATNNTVLFTTEQDKVEISLDEIILANNNITLLEGLTELSNHLVGYGVTREKEWNLQPVINLMGGFLKWQTHLTTEDAYEDGVNNATIKGYMRDEVYPMAIEFVTNTGYRTARFPFIARPALASDLEVVDTKDLDSLNANITNCGSGTRSLRWQVYNTAFKIDECALGSIPTNTIIEPVRKASRLLMPSSGSGSFVIETPDEFTTLENFINEQLQNGCFEYPFCTAADPTIPEDVIPEFEDCEDPIHDSDNDIVEVVSITEEQLEYTYFENFTDYRKLVILQNCNLYVTDPDNSYIDDQSFSDEYKPDVGEAENIWIRNYTFTNDRPRNALNLEYVERPNDPLQTSYFHDYAGYDSLAEATEIGFQSADADLPDKFQTNVGKGALWFLIDLEERNQGIFEIVKGVNPGGQDDGAAVTDYVRVNFFAENSGTGNITMFSKRISIRKSDRYKIKYEGGSLIVFREGVANEIINVTNYKATSKNKNLYIAIEAAVVPEASGKYLVRPTDYCFGVGYRAFDVDIITASYTNIQFERTQLWTANCEFKVPVVNKCQIAPKDYGEFAYNESTETYPDNTELFDSSILTIAPEDFENPENATEFQQKYAAGISEGAYILSDATDFTCKPIRHPKFPDNKISPHMYEFPQAGFSKSIIYPLGVTIDEEVINDFLNIAVNNNLITKDQRDSIIGYEIFRGDRSLDKGVVAKGLLYDMYEYKEKDKTVLFSNFPYNALGENNLILDENRTNSIQHPYTEGGVIKNHNFSFHSPDTEYYNPTIPSDMKVEGYMFGKSRGVFENVEDHPKYVILGDKAKRLASKLATLEVVAEAAIIASESAEVYRIQIGVANSVNPIGIVLNIAATALNIISAAIFKYGRYKYQWLQTFRDLGSPENFAKYYTSIGDYNFFQTLQTEGDMVRGIQKSEYLREGRAVLVNETGSEKLEINNVNRENSVFLTLGSLYSLEYPIEYKIYDNRDTNKDLSSRFYEGESLNCSKGRSDETERNIASPYVSLKNYLPSQYGTIDSVDWLSTSYRGDLRNPNSNCLPIFGGDIFITRHTLKRKFPFFLTSAMGLASKTPFNYKSYSNIGKEPRFYANFLSPDEITFDRGMPNIETEYVFDCQTNRDPFYIEPPSKFYLYYYGIPSFLTETTINTNYRTARPSPKDLFWPLIGDYVDWTQENNVPIKERNTYYYSSVYSSKPRISIGRILPSTYNKKEFDVLYDSPNGVVFSRPDNNENSLIEPWLTFRAFDKFDFDTAYGKLVDIRSIESGQVLARFESTTAIFNAFDTIIDDGATPESQTLGSGFRRRPVTFSETDLGFAGSQSSAMISNEYGHFFTDSKRGQVFYIEPRGKGIQEISGNIGDKPSGMKNWFKEHLPFKAKNPLITNYMDIDTDNPFNGLGIAMGWDSRYKRVFITKKDYRPLKPILYADKGFFKPDGYDSIINSYESDGYTYEGIEGSNLKFTKEVTSITDDADVYAIFDTTSMQLSDGVAAATALQTWFSNFQTSNPSYNGSLYIIPYSNEKYLQFSERIKLGDFAPTTFSGWDTISILPPNLNTPSWVSPTEMLLLAFIDETHIEYHNSTLAEGFFNQPTPIYFSDYLGYINNYENHYTYLKAALYPVVQNTTGLGGALVLQSLAAIKGRILLQSEINATGTTVDVSLLLTENPYANTAIPNTTPQQILQPLENLGWTGFFDKVTPASEVFNGTQFQEDLNSLVGVGEDNSTTETVLVPLTEVQVEDQEYFQDTSFTIAFNSTMGSWVSYYDFKPNYYVNHNDYFQTGMNNPVDPDEFGLWSHLLTNRSFGVFYGKKYEVGLEWPIKNNYTSKTLETIEVWAEGLRYHNQYDFAYNRSIMFNKMRIHNNREASGELTLVPQRTLSDVRKYPKTVGNTQEILITNTNDRWNINYFYNRVLTDKWNQPIMFWDINQIKRSFNNDIVKFKGKRVLEPLRGHNFLVYLGYDKDSRFAIEFNWATNIEDIR